MLGASTIASRSACEGAVQTHRPAWFQTLYAPERRIRGKPLDDRYRDVSAAPGRW